MGLTAEKKRLIIRRVIFALLLIICAVIQNTPRLLPEPFGARQLGVTVMVVCIALFERETAGMLLGLLAGIVLDTKNFTMRTGGRTFEAAAFLRRAGADTSDVQRLFQSDLAGMVERYDIIRHAELVHGDIAVAAVEKEIDRVTAAKAADELLTLSGIHASFVLFKNGTGVNLSARSLGEINVQFIMEKLGGGGNSTTAGGQVNDATVDEVRERLLAAIDEYMEE